LDGGGGDGGNSDRNVRIREIEREKEGQCKSMGERVKERVS
jgi:hypothetical protein